MSLKVFLFFCAVVLIQCAELDTRESARESKLRSGLIDAFQNIKKASAKGGIDDEGPLTSDLTGSMFQKDNDNNRREEKFDLFADEDGLSFADFSDVEAETKQPTTETPHNVQHLVKATRIDKATPKPNRDVLSKLTHSIRNAVNESRLVLRKDVDNSTDMMGIENMLRVFDAEILMKQWNELQKGLNGECKEEMQEYVDGLKEKQLWALKSK